MGCGASGRALLDVIKAQDNDTTVRIVSSASRYARHVEMLIMTIDEDLQP